MKSLTHKLLNLTDRQVLFVLVGIAVAASLLSAIVNFAYAVDTSPGWWVSWLQNFSTDDKKIARAIIKDLKNALKGEDQ